MDFINVLEQLSAQFDQVRIRYALIGGFALAMRGVQRATIGLDFILSLEKLTQADAVLRALGYRRFFHSENVSHYRGVDIAAGRIDLLHAFRTPALAMLERAERLQIGDRLSLPVAIAEDLIGLKIQAACNDQSRAAGDWQDILWLIEASGRRREALDWELIADYLELFGQTDRLAELKRHYDTLD